MKKLYTLFTAALCALSLNAQDATTLWEGEKTFDESWSGSESIDKSNFATAQAGDKIIITAEPVEAVEWQWGSQVFIKTKRDGWDAIASTVNVNKAGDYTVDISDTELTLENAKETTTMLAELKEYGLVIQGIDAKITKVSLKAAVVSSEKELTLTEGHTILISEFVNYPDDYQVKLSFVNNTDPYESRSGWGIGGFANSDNWSPTYAVKGLDGATFDVYVTIGDFKKAAKNETDDYVVGQYHGAGVTFNFYNDCKLTGVYVIIPQDTQGISSNVLAPAENANAPLFNLAGQQVGKSYKGVVIQNGKKFIQR